MKDVVENEVMKREKFKKLLTKICEDFKIKDSKEVIENFLKNKDKTI